MHEVSKTFLFFPKTVNVHVCILIHSVDVRLFAGESFLKASSSSGCFPTWTTPSWTTTCRESLSSTCGPADPCRTSSRISGSRVESLVAKTKPTTFSPTSLCASSSWWVPDVLLASFVRLKKILYSAANVK